jgi:hypothetical protein
MMARHKLLTAKILKQLPPLYATENVPVADKVVVVKFFTMFSNWTWYAVEFDGDDLFFGLVDGLEREWGYFSLRELRSIGYMSGNQFVPTIERDLYFEPKTVKEIFPPA